MTLVVAVLHVLFMLLETFLGPRRKVSKSSETARKTQRKQTSRQKLAPLADIFSGRDLADRVAAMLTKLIGSAEVAPL
jgi:uncharacterized membrane protein